MAIHGATKRLLLRPTLIGRRHPKFFGNKNRPSTHIQAAPGLLALTGKTLTIELKDSLFGLALIKAKPLGKAPSECSLMDLWNQQFSIFAPSQVRQCPRIVKSNSAAAEEYRKTAKLGHYEWEITADKFNPHGAIASVSSIMHYFERLGIQFEIDMVDEHFLEFLGANIQGLLYYIEGLDTLVSSLLANQAAKESLSLTDFPIHALSHLYLSAQEYSLPVDETFDFLIDLLPADISLLRTEWSQMKAIHQKHAKQGTWESFQIFLIELSQMVTSEELNFILNLCLGPGHAKLKSNDCSTLMSLADVIFTLSDYQKNRIFSFLMNHRPMRREQIRNLFKRTFNYEPVLFHLSDPSYLGSIVVKQLMRAANIDDQEQAEKLLHQYLKDKIPGHIKLSRFPMYLSPIGLFRIHFIDFLGPDRKLSINELNPEHADYKKLQEEFRKYLFPNGVVETVLNHKKNAVEVSLWFTGGQRSIDC